MIAIGTTQSPFMKDNLYQEKERAIEWQSIHGCCVETLPMVTGYIVTLLFIDEKIEILV